MAISCICFDVYQTRLPLKIFKNDNDEFELETENHVEYNWHKFVNVTNFCDFKMKVLCLYFSSEIADIYITDALNFISFDVS